MAKWEYAAIVQSGVVSIGAPKKIDIPRWILVQPGKENHFIANWVQHGDALSTVIAEHPWRNPIRFEQEKKRVKIAFKSPIITNLKTTNASPKVLYESSDILHLVNLAGADGWEITGGLGLGDGGPGTGKYETKWRMMRREL